MTASKREKLSAITAFLEWAWGAGSVREGEDVRILLDRYADEVLTECDTAIAHGPGHQSISECIVTGDHTEHHSDMSHEWYSSDLTGQTYARRRDGRTFRLAFADSWP